MSQTENIKHLRQRQLLINKVRNYWVKGVLEKSLYNQILIELDLEERLDRIAYYIPWNYANFLNYTTHINLLQKIGGGYIFIHRLLK